MKKPYRHWQMSSVICQFATCSKRLKLNLVMRKQPGNPLFCFKHYNFLQAKKGHFTKHNYHMKQQKQN